MDADPRSRPPRGFTLLEVMIALAILGLMLTAILSAQAGLYGQNVQARNLTLGTSAARCKMTEVEEDLLKNGYSEIDQLHEGPCCEGESPAGFTCKWAVERVTLPDPPSNDPGLGDAGAASAMGGQTRGSGGAPGGPLGALMAAATSPSTIASGGVGGLSEALSSQTGPNGQTGLQGMAGMALTIVYPQLRPLLEASIRRVTVDAVWNEGPTERKVTLVLFVTNPNRGLPPIDPMAAGSGSVPPPSAAGLSPAGLNPLGPSVVGRSVGGGRF